MVVFIMMRRPQGSTIVPYTTVFRSGVSTGACIGHVGPEALAGGPIGKVQDGDLIEIIIDKNNLVGSVNLVGDKSGNKGKDWGDKQIDTRPRPTNLRSHPKLPIDSRLWAALQDASGGTWGGCVFDVDDIVQLLEAGKDHIANKSD